MAALTIQDIRSNLGTQIDFVAATVTVGDTIALTDDSVKALVNNASGAPITVTVKSYQTVQGLALPDRTVTVAAGKIKAIPLYKALNANPLAGSIATLICSSVTTVTIAAVQG